MTVVVAYKWAPNPADAVVRPDGVVDFTRAHPAVSEDDPVALTLGRQVADAAGAACVGVSVGPESVASPTARKAALARGLDRALLVADDATADWNLTRVGEALAALVRRVPDATLVVAGEASVDLNARLVPALTAGFLGWPCFASVLAITATDAGWRLVQRVADGTRTIDVAGPVVASVAPDATAVAAPGMRDVLAAARKPVEVVPVADLVIGAASVTVVARARIERARAGHVHADTDALAAALRADKVI